MKGWVGWVLLVLSILIAIAGYGNSRNEPATEQIARTMVCSIANDCVKMSERPHAVRTDYVSRRYEWTTSLGPMHVVCKRRLLFIGNWECQAKQGPIAP